MSLVIILGGGYLVLMLVVLLFVVAQFRVAAAADRRQEQYERELAAITTARVGEPAGRAAEARAPAETSPGAAVRRARRPGHRRVSLRRHLPKSLR